VPKDDALVFEGVVEESSNGQFKIRISDQYTALCTLSGKIRQSGIKIVLGDNVRIEVSPYDVNRGRIIYRIK
jgi:translation initiation factor IF-1